MISELRGTVSGIAADSVTLDIHGVGLQVYVTPGLLGGLSEGMEVHLFTRLMVKEDGWNLYGFRLHEERACFELLLNVKGIVSSLWGSCPGLSRRTSIGPSSTRMSGR